MAGDLKDELISEMKRVGAYDVRIADPHQGFEYAPEGRHPLEIMPGCNSVVAFVVPCADIPDAFFVGIRRSVPQAPDYWTQVLHTEDNELYLGHSEPLSRVVYWVDRAQGRVRVDVTPSTLRARPGSGSGRVRMSS